MMVAMMMTMVAMMMVMMMMPTKRQNLIWGKIYLPHEERGKVCALPNACFAIVIGVIIIVIIFIVNIVIGVIIIVIIVIVSNVIGSIIIIHFFLQGRFGLKSFILKLEVLGPSGPRLLGCGPSGGLWALRACSITSFTPLWRSGRLTHATAYVWEGVGSIAHKCL